MHQSLLLSPRSSSAATSGAGQYPWDRSKAEASLRKAWIRAFPQSSIAQNQPNENLSARQILRQRFREPIAGGGKTPPLEEAFAAMRFFEKRIREHYISTKGKGGVPLPLFVMSNLYPSHRTALNIFEPRYRLMIRRCLEGSQLFGMVEHDPTNLKGFYPTGTVVRIVNSTPQPDGRYLIEIVAEGRVTITDSWEMDGYAVGCATPLVDNVEEHPPTQEDVTWIKDQYDAFCKQYPSAVPGEALTTEMQSFFLCGLLEGRLEQSSSEILKGTDFGRRVALLKASMDRRWWPA